MSETPRNDMERDAKLTELYRAAAQNEPPPALDDAIRAAARRKIGARPRHTGSSLIRSWRVPLSIAAVILLSVSLMTLMREETPEVAQPPRAESPAFPGAAEMRDNKVAAPAEQPRWSVKEDTRRDVSAAPAEAQQRSQASAPIAAASPAAKPLAPSPVPQVAGSIGAYVNLPPEKWLERIEELRKQGRIDEARTNLAEFRKRHPDYPLPAALKDGIKP